MTRTRMPTFAALGAALAIAAPASPQLLPRNRTPGTPKLEPIAETKLLMEGLLQANFRGLSKNLGQPPADVETWTFVRGQALLIAETSNLLLIRPPKSGGQDTWMTQATELREKATTLARSAAARDAQASRRELTDLSGTCNRCHQAFRVKAQVTPFAAQE